MKPETLASSSDDMEQIFELVETLHRTEERLEKLTGGEVDSVIDRQGQTFFLRRAQEELRFSDAVRQAAILNALPAQIALLDIQGIIVSVNESWRKFATSNALQSPGFGVGQNYVEICERVIGDCSEEAHAASKGIRRILQGEVKEFALEYPCHSPTEKRWFRLVVTPVNSDHLAGAVVMHLNITERKLADEALRSSENQMALGQRIAHLGSWELELTNTDDVDANPLHWSDEMFRIAGFEPGKIAVTNELFFRLVPADEHDKIRQAVATAILERQPYSIVHRLIRPNGEERIVHEEAQVLFDEKTGLPWKMVGTAHDITERKLADEALRESEERFRGMFVGAAAGIAISTPKGRYLQANAAYCRMLGYTEAELQTMNFASVTHPDDLNLNLEMRDELLAGQRESLIMEKRYAKKGGGIMWAQTSVSATHTTSGELATLIVIAEDISERKLAEEQLRSKTAVLEAQLNSTLDGILILDSEGNKILQNQQMVDLWNIPQEFADDPVDRRQREWVTQQVKYPGEFAKTIDFFQSHPDEVTRDELELTDGRFFDRYSSPVRGRDGKLYGRIIALRDITERKQAQEQSRKQIELLNMASRVGKLGAWAIEFPGPRIVWSEEVYRLHEVEPDFKPDLSTALDFFPPASRLKLETAIHNKQAYDLELDFITATGKKLLVRTTCATEMHNGEVRRLFGIFQDLTERKKIEARFRLLVDSNVQGVLFWNRNGQITGGNDAFLRLTGYSREDLDAGLIDWISLTPPEYANLDRLCLEQITLTGVGVPYEKEYIRKDGSRVPILLGAAAFEDNPDNGVCFVLDLTERKKLENQFLRAQRMESIGTLAGGIAHDLNNALAPIMMSIDLLSMKFPDPASQELLATLSSSAQRGADMVRQVLSFARGVEGRHMEVQVGHVIKDVEKIAKDTFQKNIQVRTIIGREPWTIMGDPTQVHQVLLNLCVNARDAMPDGGTITLSTENVQVDQHYAGLLAEAQPGPYLLLQVEDTGSGMPQGVLEKIFDPFFTTKEIGKGTGLGLSTSQAIVKSHGGFMRVYSEMGKGTKFKVYFPAQTGASSGVAEEIAAEMPRGNGEIILVVDDEASVRHITQQTLQAFGYRVILASDGVEAVSVFARQGPEIAVVLTDMMMPVMDGPALIRVLRKLKPTLPIIGASGLSANKDISKSGSLGINHFLPKPYMANELLKVLREILTTKPEASNMKSEREIKL